MKNNKNKEQWIYCKKILGIRNGECCVETLAFKPGITTEKTVVERKTAQEFENAANLAKEEIKKESVYEICNFSLQSSKEVTGVLETIILDLFSKSPKYFKTTHQEYLRASPEVAEKWKLLIEILNDHKPNLESLTTSLGELTPETKSLRCLALKELDNLLAKIKLEFAKKMPNDQISPSGIPATKEKEKNDPYKTFEEDYKVFFEEDTLFFQHNRFHKGKPTDLLGSFKVRNIRNKRPSNLKFATPKKYTEFKNSTIEQLTLSKIIKENPGLKAQELKNGEPIKNATKLLTDLI